PYAARKLAGNMKAANKLGARFAAIIGEKEREAGTTTLREMTSGEEETVPLDAVAVKLGKRLR
ncbi:MAG: His/Gly/Thr/Pro-type tRNA ligase C-terminal domain-containing protein, partial [Actinomycetota bacterium]